ncbi:hypothetical protein BROUX41_001012 [Berkeleyomyces rouxiae]|uniref:uncharacterized protein n=1 Tax=Berkeleyomyces rouxiae TaxID=2035830 RepID=UPI003B7CD39A
MPPTKKNNNSNRTGNSRLSKSAHSTSGSANAAVSVDETMLGVPDSDGEVKLHVPEELITRVLHDVFEKDSTRLSKDANRAVGKYLDVFIREALMRAAAERGARFLEVEDLERLAPQLLLDF